MSRLARLRGVEPLVLAVGALVAVVAIQLPLVLNRAINWDEFYHYSQVQKLSQGTLTEPLQTLYARAFVWVPDLPGTGVDHVLVIRLFMLGCELVTIAAIVGIASRFTDRRTAVLCGVAYVSFAYVLKHGTSFRFDPAAAALLMSAAWILLRRKLDALGLLLPALLIGISAVLTIKTILYAPVFAGIAWLRWTEDDRRPETLVRLIIIGIASLATAGIVYVLHASTLGEESAGQARNLMSRAGASMFAFGNPLYWRHALYGAIASPVVSVAVLAAPFVIWKSTATNAEKIALAGLWLPLTTLLFYRNTAPYYYVYMLPPVIAAAGPALAVAVRRYGTAFVAVILLLCAAVVLFREPYNPIDRQRAILEEADRLFPGGVAYFDRYAMLGRFPKANAFMTPWGIEHYLAGNLPKMSDEMARQPVPLVVNNGWMFQQALHSNDPVPEFLPADLAAIRETYIPLWGPFWIAGRTLPARSGERIWNVRVPGPYTVHGGPVRVDGQLMAAGAVIVLQRGRHIVRADAAPARLLWGENLRIPKRPAPAKPYEMPF